MTIKEFYEKYGDVELTEEQEEHIRKYLKIKGNKKWRPEEGDLYYYVDDYGKADYSVFDDDNWIDDYRLISNNYFKTREEAEFRLEQIKVYNELKNFADENNEDDVKTERYLITLQSGDLIVLDYTYMHHIGEIGFSSKELAEQAIEKVGADRIKKYLFGVE